jgi:hypothetical protein
MNRFPSTTLRELIFEFRRMKKKPVTEERIIQFDQFKLVIPKGQDPGSARIEHMRGGTKIEIIFGNDWGTLYFDGKLVYQQFMFC